MSRLIYKALLPMMNFKTILLYLFFGSWVMVFSQSQKNSHTSLDRNKVQIDSIPENNTNLEGYPVNPFDDTLFIVYNRIGVFSAQDRAQAITKRIESVSKDPLFNKNSLRISKTDYGLEIVYNRNLVVMSVTNSDGKKVGSTNFELAQKNLAIIQKAVLFQKKKNSTANWFKPAGILVLIVVGIVVIVFAFKKRYRRI